MPAIDCPLESSDVQTVLISGQQHAFANASFWRHTEAVSTECEVSAVRDTGRSDERGEKDSVGIEADRQGGFCSGTQGL